LQSPSGFVFKQGADRFWDGFGHQHHLVKADFEVGVTAFRDRRSFSGKRCALRAGYCESLQFSFPRNLQNTWRCEKTGLDLTTD
jgi:hypothetical protein